MQPTQYIKYYINSYIILYSLHNIHTIILYILEGANALLTRKRARALSLSLSLTYADVCWRMLTYAGWRWLTRCWRSIRGSASRPRRFLNSPSSRTTKTSRYPIQALLRRYQASLNTLKDKQASSSLSIHPLLSLSRRSLNALFRNYSGSMQALFRLNAGSIQAQCRLYSGSIKALLS